MGTGGPQPAYQVTPWDLQLEAVPLDIEDPEALAYILSAPFPVDNEVVDDFEVGESSGDDERVAEPEEPLSQEGPMDECLECNSNNNAENQSIRENRPKSRSGGPVDYTSHHHQMTRNFQPPFPSSIMNSSSNNINTAYSTDEEQDSGQSNEHHHATNEPSNHSITQDGRRSDTGPSIDDLKLLKISSVIKCNRNQSMGGNLSGEKDRSKRGGRHGRRTMESAQRKRRRSADNGTSGKKREVAKKSRPGSCRSESSADVPAGRGETEVSTYNAVSAGAVGKDVHRMSVHEDCIVETAPQNGPLHQQARGIAGHATTKPETKCDVFKMTDHEQSDEDTNAENTLMEEESIYDLDPTTVTGYTSCSEWWNGNEAGAAAPPPAGAAVVAADSRNTIASLTDECHETPALVNSEGNDFHEERLHEERLPAVDKLTDGLEQKTNLDASSARGGDGACDENLGADIKLESTSAEVGWVSPEGEKIHSAEDPADSSSVTNSAKCRKRGKGRVTFKEPVAYTASSEYDFGTFFIQKSSQENGSLAANRSGYSLTQGVSHSALVRAKSESTLDNVRDWEFLAYQDYIHNFPQPPQSLGGSTLDMTSRRSRSRGFSQSHLVAQSEQSLLPCVSKEDTSFDPKSQQVASSEPISRSSYSNGEVECMSCSVQLKSVDLRGVELPDAAKEHCDDSENTSKLSLLKSLSSATVVSDFAQCDADEFDVLPQDDSFECQHMVPPDLVFYLPASDQPQLLDPRFSNVDNTAESSVFEAKCAGTQESPATLDLTCCDHNLQLGSILLEHNISGGLKSKLSGTRSSSSSKTISESVHQESLHSQLPGVKFSKQTVRASKSLTAISCHRKYHAEGVLPCKPKIRLSVSTESLPRQRKTLQASRDECGLFEVNTMNGYIEGGNKTKRHVSEARENTSFSTTSGLRVYKSVHDLQWSQCSEYTKICDSFQPSIGWDPQQAQPPGTGQSASDIRDVTDHELQMPHPKMTSNSAAVSSLDRVNLFSQSFVTAKSASVICQSLDSEFKPSARVKSESVICQSLDSEFKPSATVKSESVICQSLDSEFKPSATVKSESVICQSLDSEFKPSATVKSESVICQSLDSEFKPSATVKSESVICQSLKSELISSAAVKSESVICQSLDSELKLSATVKSESVICQSLDSELKLSATVKSESVICQSLDSEFKPSATVKSESVICQSLDSEFKPSATVKSESVICQSLDSEFKPSATVKSESVICQSFKSELKSSAAVKSESVICQSLDSELKLSATVKSESSICQSLDSEFKPSATVKSESVICQSLDSEFKPSATVKSESVICQSLDSEFKPSATVKSESVICQSLDSELKSSATVKSESVNCQSLDSEFKPSATVKSESVICQSLDSEFKPSAAVKSESVNCRSVDSAFQTKETAIFAIVFCQSLESESQPNETAKSESVICQSIDTEFQPNATFKTESVISQSLENDFQTSATVKSASVLSTSLTDNASQRSRSSFTARSPNLVYPSLDDLKQFVVTKSASVLCVSLDNELRSHVTTKSSSSAGQNLDQELQPYVTVKSSSVICQSLDDELQQFAYPKAASVLCQTPDTDSGGTRPTVTNNTISVYYKNADDKSQTHDQTDIPSLFISEDAATLSHQQEMNRSSSTSAFGALGNANGVQFPNKTDVSGFAHSVRSNGQDAYSCPPCAGDTTDIADSFTFSQTIKSSNLAGDLVSAVVQCDSADFPSPAVNDTVSASAQCESWYFSFLDIRSRSSDSTFYIGDVSSKQKKSAGVQISITEWPDSDDQSIVMDSTLSSIGDIQSESIHCPISELNSEVISKTPKRNSASDFETACVQSAPLEVTSGDHIYVKSFSIQAGEDVVKDVGTLCSLSSLKDLTISGSLSQVFDDSSNVKTINKHKSSEYVSLTTGDQRKLSDSILNNREEGFDFIDHGQEDLPSIQNRDERLGVVLTDQVQRSLPLCDQDQHTLISSNQSVENVALPNKHSVSLAAHDPQPLTDHHQKSLALSDQHQESLSLSDPYQKSLVLTDHHHESLALSDHHHRESLALSDQYQKSLDLSEQHHENLALSDHHQECLALSDHHQECLALSDHHQECLAFSDHHQECLALSDHNQECLALSDHHQECLALSDHHQECLALSDHHKESLALSDQHQECLALSDHHQESLALSDHHKESLALSDQHQESLALSDQYQESLALSDQYQKSLALSDHHQESLPLSDHHQESLALADHHQKYLALSDQHQESLALSDQYQKSLPLSDHHQESLALSEPHQVSLTLSDHHQESVALSDHHQESLALSDHHQESLALADHHQKYLALSDHHQESLALSDHHQESLALSDHHQESLTLSDHHQESLALSDHHQESLASAEHRHESLSLFDQSNESVSATNSKESLPHFGISKKPQVATNSSHFLPALVARRRAQESDRHVSNDLPKISQVNLRSSPIDNSRVGRTELRVLERVDPSRHAPELFTAHLPQSAPAHSEQNSPAPSQQNTPASSQQNAPDPLQQNAPSCFGTLSSKMTKKKLPSLSLRTVNDKKVSLSDVPEEDVSSIRTTRSLQKESTRPPDVRQERMKQRSAGRRKVLKDMELSSDCDTLATKEDVVEYSTKRNSLLGKVTFGDHLKRAPVSSKRLASPRQSSDLENKDVTCSVLPSEASATLCNTLEDVDAIASSISIATPTRNSLCVLEDGSSLATTEGEALKQIDRDDRKDNVLQDVDACGDITNICDVLDHLVKPDTRTQMSTLSELTVYTVGDDPELQIKLSEDNLESLAVLDLPIAEETSDRAHDLGDAGGELAGDVEQTDVVEDLSEQALRTPGLQAEEEDLSEQALRTPGLQAGEEEDLSEQALRTPGLQAEEEDLSEQALRTPGLQAEQEEKLSEQKLKTQARQQDETEDLSGNTLRTQGPQASKEKDLTERALRTPGLEDRDQVESAEAPDSRSSGSSVKKVKGDGTVEGKDGIETSDDTFTTIANDTETKAGGDKPQKRASRQVPGGSPGGPPGGPPDDVDKKKPTEKLKRKKVDRNVLFPPRVIAESHYYKHNNTINVVVKPVNAQLPTDGLNVKVHVHRRQSRLPVIPSHGVGEARKRSQPSPTYTLKKRVSNTLPLITLDRDIIDVRAANPPFNTATNPEADTRYKKITRNWRVR